jgi:hypothetical protein
MDGAGAFEAALMDGAGAIDVGAEASVRVGAQISLRPSAARSIFAAQNAI